MSLERNFQTATAILSPLAAAYQGIPAVPQLQLYSKLAALVEYQSGVASANGQFGMRAEWSQSPIAALGDGFAVLGEGPGVVASPDIAVPTYNRIVLGPVVALALTVSRAAIPIENPGGCSFLRLYFAEVGDALHPGIVGVVIVGAG